MEQIERIIRMEQILDEATEAVSYMAEALEKYQGIRGHLQQLIAYYDSEQWRQDFDDDTAGKLPSDLKRGVLSEDAVYNFLSEHNELIEQLHSLSQL